MDRYSFFGDESKIFVQITLINVRIAAVSVYRPIQKLYENFTYITIHMIQTHVACSMVIIRTIGHVGTFVTCISKTYPFEKGKQFF